MISRESGASLCSGRLLDEIRCVLGADGSICGVRSEGRRIHRWSSFEGFGKTLSARKRAFSVAVWRGKAYCLPGCLIFEGLWKRPTHTRGMAEQSETALDGTLYAL
jgi:hypothetical protein